MVKSYELLGLGAGVGGLMTGLLTLQLGGDTRAMVKARKSWEGVGVGVPLCCS